MPRWCCASWSTRRRSASRRLVRSHPSGRFGPGDAAPTAASAAKRPRFEHRVRHRSAPRESPPRQAAERQGPKENRRARCSTPGGEGRRPEKSLVSLAVRLAALRRVELQLPGHSSARCSRPQAEPQAEPDAEVSGGRRQGSSPTTLAQDADPPPSHRAPRRLCLGACVSSSGRDRRVSRCHRRAAPV